MRAPASRRAGSRTPFARRRLACPAEDTHTPGVAGQGARRTVTREFNCRILRHPDAGRCHTAYRVPPPRSRVRGPHRHRYTYVTPTRRVANVRGAVRASVTPPRLSAQPRRTRYGRAVTTLDTETARHTHMTEDAMRAPVCRVRTGRCRACAAHTAHSHARARTRTRVPRVCDRIRFAPCAWLPHARARMPGRFHTPCKRGAVSGDSPNLDATCRNRLVKYKGEATTYRNVKVLRADHGGLGHEPWQAGRLKTGYASSCLWQKPA